MLVFTDGKMRFPDIPPSYLTIFEDIKTQGDVKLNRFLTEIQATDYKGRYLHWDKLKYKNPPDDFTAEEYWAGTKFARSKLLQDLPLLSKSQQPFKFCSPSLVQKMLLEIDRNASGYVGMSEPIANENTRNTYLINSLIEEAINSSQLEGAATTRKVAKKMIRNNRTPQDQGEQMIFNNFYAMQFVQEHKDDMLTPSMVYELHRIVTDKTLPDATHAGRLRTGDDEIHVVDHLGNILHTPPDAEELPARLKALCDFANGLNERPFVHPVIRAILLHFMLAYDHPFVDGNGRTARALFYWCMAKEKYWLIDFISISQIIKEAYAQYAKAFLYTETDENDTTYFIIHQLEVIQKAIVQLYAYLERKVNDLRSAVHLVEKTNLNGVLNYRQLAVLDHALKNPNALYRIREHQNTHGVTYQTARTDLLKMSDDMKLLNKLKEGKRFVFLAPTDMRQRLERLQN